MGETAIEWTDTTWNPVTGCSKVSPGCANCYAERVTKRFQSGEGSWKFKPWTPENAAENVVLHPDRLDAPLHWKKQRRVFVNSMSDLFHENVPDEFIDRVFAVMRHAAHHTYQILTKRPERMKAYFDRMTLTKRLQLWGSAAFSWPLPAVWLGVSVENQHWADERIPLLLQTPAAVRFLSIEPLLGPIDLQGPVGGTFTAEYPATGLDWVIVGGESGGPADRALVEQVSECVAYDRIAGSTYRRVWKPKREAEQWVRDLRDQCIGLGIPFFFKQWGGPRPTSGGRELFAREWNQFPEVKVG